MRYTFCTVIILLSVRLMAETPSINPEFLGRIPNGDYPYELRYEPSIAGGPSSPVALIVNEEHGRIYVADEPNSAIKSFALDLKYLQSWLTRDTAFEYSRFLCFVIENRLLGVSGKDVMLYRLDNSSLCFDIDTHLLWGNSPSYMDIFAIGGNILYVAGDGHVGLIDYDGKIYSQERAVTAMAAEAVTAERYEPRIEAALADMRESGMHLLFGDRYFTRDIHKMKSFFALFDTSPQRRKDNSYADFNIDNLYLVGYDKDHNSYWHEIIYDKARLVVFDKYGNVLYVAFFQNIYYNIYKSPGVSLIVADSGNVYFMSPSPTGTSFYLLKNTWAPVSRGKYSAVLSSISASSTQTEATDRNAYNPVKLFDGDPKTMWIEGAQGPGIGQSVTLSFDKPMTADEIRFEPGCFWPEYWKQNYRVKKLEVKLDGKAYNVDFKDEMTVQSLKLPVPITFTTAVFTIKDVYPTTKWEDTAISEISFYNQGAKIGVDYSKFKDFLKKAP